MLTAERHEPAARQATSRPRHQQGDRDRPVALGPRGGRRLRLVSPRAASADERQLVLQGNIDVRQVNLAFKVDGRIASLAVDEGDSVKAGQVIATLDKRYFDDDLRLAQAHRDNAKASLARLEHGSRRKKSLRPRPKSPSSDHAHSLGSGFRTRRTARRTRGRQPRDVRPGRSALDKARARLKYAEETGRHGRHWSAAGRHRRRPGENVRRGSGRACSPSGAGRQRVDRPQRRRHSHAHPRKRGHRRRQRNGLHAHARVPSLGTHIRQRAGPGKNSSRHAGHGDDRFGAGQTLQGRHRLYLAGGGINSQDGRDAQATHEPCLPAAYSGRQSRQRSSRRGCRSR